MCVSCYHVSMATAEERLNICALFAFEWVTPPNGAPPNISDKLHQSSSFRSHIIKSWELFVRDLLPVDWTTACAHDEIFPI